MGAIVKYRIVIYGLGLFLFIALYQDIVKVPLMFDDVSNVIESQEVREFSGVFRYGILNSFVRKPLGLFSMILNYKFSHENLNSYRWVNMGIHFLNTVLLSELLIIWGCMGLFAFIFLLFHPSALYVIAAISGRYYSLGLLFFLTCFYLFQLSDRRKDWLLFLGFVLACLTKQYFVVLLLVYFWLKPISLKGRPKTLLLTSFFVSGAIFVGFAIRNFRNSFITMDHFLLSQLGNFWTTVMLFIFPQKMSYIPDLPIFYEWNWATMSLPIFVISTSVILIVKHREILWVRWLGAFAILLLPTNSVFPRSEVLIGWRLYVPLFALTTAFCLINGRKYFRIISGFFLGFFLLNGTNVIAKQILTYQDPVATFRQEFDQNPQSYLGCMGLGTHLFFKNLHRESIPIFHQCLKIRPMTYQPWHMIAEAHRILGEKEAEQEARKQAYDISKKMKGQHLNTYRLHQFLE